ncbi:hypothetical protein SPRG_10382 [Saprolegnia parasitica CBS 223.65]|uniref:CW-type domain-containing protein n=1 Tax=Saprolegnia parasitica (strain CBS 223.65) TaxID=695850 RepID=A0A067CBX1_SAPPC|nr:hypothetical protein SPRG_10382 [Saprolegnia parasitica CBS 223.65]KDO24307.1 hypothetical protein SPRG_10382 [Saprolegnia parasitica CBS 223.65]|eukprot:XP_012204904.1 hypothetical protein SPRG_10382 [Saprolegnia parasitica CBS 223.65]
MRGGWSKEPLVAERIDAYLLQWDKTTQPLPDVFDTTTRKPENEADIVVHFAACIKYHDTTLTRTQFIKEYGELPRSRDGEILRLREALVEQYCIDIEMDAKKAAVLRSDDSWMDEVDAIVPTAHRVPKPSPADRLKYITSLWPTNMPHFKDSDESLDYFGFEVGIYIEPETAPTPTTTTKDDEETKTADESEVDAAPETVQQLAMGHSSKEENWVQCDKCQKWRKLPDTVDVSGLPAIWYCRMNKWSRRFNKCSAAEETTVVPLKDTDLKSLKERKFVYQFAQRLKRMEKAMQDLKYTDAKDDDGSRQFVQCQVCHKKRPLLAGMDPRKVPQPFLCWMNSWDELHASCSAPQGELVERSPESSPAPEPAAPRPKKVKDKDAPKKSEKEPTKRANKAAKAKAGSLSGSSASVPPPLYSSSDEDNNVKPTTTKSAATSKRKGTKDAAKLRKRVKK